MSNGNSTNNLLWSPNRSIRTQQDAFRIKVIDLKLNISDIPEWFQGSEINFAENILKHDDDKIALYSTSEGDRSVKTTTFAELRVRVALFAAAMKEAGIVKGDRVVGYLPNCPLAIEAMLAASSIGAIWSVTSPDFGVTGVLDRFRQIKPKMIFSVEAVVYNGKIHDHLEKLNQVVENLPEIEKVIVMPYVEKNESKITISDIKNSIFLSKFLGLVKVNDEPLPALTFEPLPFNHPLYIMYSSGTTGTPKCIVHSAGGTLIKHIEEHVLQGNMTKDDILFYFTSTGWMMWNWQLSALFTGAAIVLYDGSPFKPTTDIIFNLIDDIGITVFGTGAKYLDVIEAKELKPRETHRLTSLRTILSTGSPLKPSSFRYVYSDIKNDLLLGSITGGTDIIACFAGNNSNGDINCGEIQCRMLGMAMKCFDERGEEVFDREGELVCTVPFPSQPIYFWNDSNSEQAVGEKYKKAYFASKYGDKVWAHSDFCKINKKTGGVWMLGRSDGTLNPNGVRFGSSEIYHIVEQVAEISDSLCVSQYKNRDVPIEGENKLDEERVILFILLKDGYVFSKELELKIRVKIRSQLSAHHVPTIILPIDEIPYTHNGKKIEVAVKKVISGEQVNNRGSFSNPNCLDLYQNIVELKGY